MQLETKRFERLPQRLVLDSGVDLRGRNVPVAEGTLHKAEVACLRVEPGGEGVPERVN